MSVADFTQKVRCIVSNGFVTAGLSFGTRLGLFKGLADLAQSKETSVTTQQLADSLNYKERYVREWINGMVCGDVVDHEEIDGVDRYWLEPYRLPALLGDKFQWPALDGEMLSSCLEVYTQIEDCFRMSGPSGMDVDAYPGLHEYQAKLVAWKTPENCKILLEDEELLQRLEKGINVLELGCGAAEPTKAIATCYPNSKFLATDISEINLAKARENCKDLPNVSYQLLDACNVPDDMATTFDLVILFDLYHDVPYPQQLVDGACRLLKKGGQFYMFDVDLHESVTDNKNTDAVTSATYYLVSNMYCMATSAKHPNSEALGACAGKELIERRMKKDFTQVKRVAKDYGLFLLCTK